MADVTDFLVNGGLLIVGGIIAFIITGRYQKHKDGRETRNKMLGRCTELGHKMAVVYELFRNYHATFNNNQNNRAELKSKIMDIAIDYYA